MAFGFPMLIPYKTDANIVLRPFELSEAERVASLISSYEVCRFTGTTSSKSTAQELEWIEKYSSDENNNVWAICTTDSLNDYKGQVIGVTSVSSKNGRGSSGIIIFERNFWNNGIASRCHRARCFYAHNNLGLKAIDSTVIYDNLGSLKALLKVGYAITGTEYSKHFADGQFHHAHRLTWVNPTKHKWMEFWGANKPPAKFLKARIRAQAALDSARAEVTFL